MWTSVKTLLHFSQSSALMRPTESRIWGPGLHFAVTPQKANNVEFAAAVEIALKQVDVANGWRIRIESARVLNSLKPNRGNLDPDERFRRLATMMISSS